MATTRKEERKYRYYNCGQCNTPIEYPKTDDPPNPCPDCGYRHVSRDKYKLPDEIKGRIN